LSTLPIISSAEQHFKYKSENDDKKRAERAEERDSDSDALRSSADMRQRFAEMDIHSLRWRTEERKAMKININVTHNFTINGKQYHSVEEMPDEVRQVFEKAKALQAGSGKRILAAGTRSKIIFNGREHEIFDTMPEDVRQLCEKALKAAESPVASSGVDIPRVSGGNRRKPDTAGTPGPGEISKPTKVESSFSPRMLLMTAGLLALIFLLYCLFQNR
jgi:hypothetical protein